MSEYIDLTYHRNLEELMDNGIEGMFSHTIYHIKGDVIWALVPKAKHEIMREVSGAKSWETSIYKNY